ncbi:3',5'-cyclic-nucleotide phosphodiesterase [Colletotrichum sidae]|uniref:3',5'-cyclic-nucleotide phosphodiesterase n=1 Tax=Colletotrichum sidae TaxID=1347389 RepID=A0A4V3I2D7_9PEZI|nr:3',5'-cyclic-nucleotide phosphodiesterase [Colletotrichum sidae]
MEDTNGEPERPRRPSLQVIVLGSGGGPMENNTTALLVRSVASGWAKGSTIAVDAGVHLSAITGIIEKTVPPGLGVNVPLPYTLMSGPFAGMELTSRFPSTVAAHITRSVIDTYLITHPHLDHIAGFVINTAGLTRPKRLAALPPTIDAIKTHIFNNKIWPNMSDENNGAGLVTYTRLTPGGSPAAGDGDSKGYLEVADGLAVKAFAVSHGHCVEQHAHRGSTSSAATPHRYPSVDAGSVASPRILPHGLSSNMVPIPRAMSIVAEPIASECVYDSSAYFILDLATNREILVFGDVEPDSLSLSPRNLEIWQEATPKIVSGQLAAVFIECSYDDSQSVDRLFGHLKPCYLIEELQTLAAEVEGVRQVHPPRKRKRVADADVLPRRKPGGALSRLTGGDESPVSPKSVAKRALSADISNVPQLPPAATSVESPHLTTPTKELSLKEMEASMSESEDGHSRGQPLKGLKVVIIHVKERLDGRDMGDVILNELLAHEEVAQLGCEFILSRQGQSIYL